MTRRSRSTMESQTRTLTRLNVVRRRSEPGPARRWISEPVFARITVLNACESVVYAARLGRMAAAPEDDDYFRMLVVVANALTDAVAADITSATTSNTHALYRRVVAPGKE